MPKDARLSTDIKIIQVNTFIQASINESFLSFLAVPGHSTDAFKHRLNKLLHLASFAYVHRPTSVLLLTETADLCYRVPHCFPYFPYLPTVQKWVKR